jgi:hypothetical protein
MMEHMEPFQQQIRRNLIVWKDYANDKRIAWYDWVRKNGPSWPIESIMTARNDVPKYIRLYSDIMVQHKNRLVTTLGDHEKRAIIVQKLQEQKYIRFWRTYILLPCIVIFIIGDLYYNTIHHSIPIDGKLRNTNSTSSSSSSNSHSMSDTATVFAQMDKTMIDIISVGTLLKDDSQKAQIRTFGQHPTVRNYFRITERNDTDSTCFTSLTSDQLDRIVDFCANTKDESFISTTLRKQLFQPKKHTGWMCAQKRPLDGLYQVLKQYRTTGATSGTMDIPDYLFIIDDDTYLNMNPLVTDLLLHHPASIPYAVAGCNMDHLTESGITFPYGGYGSFLTKAAIQRMLQPIYCNTEDGRQQDDHSILGCWRMRFNAIGEKEFFSDGMSVVDLMQTYAAKLPFTGVESWTKTGYCLHSDHALAFFVNFYHIPLPDGKLAEYKHPKDKMRRRYSFMQLAGRKESECQHEKDNCSTEHRICHRIKPTQMNELYEKTIQQQMTTQ